VPLDQRIETSILENQEPWKDAWNTMPAEKSPAVVDDLLTAYGRRLQEEIERLQPAIPATPTTVPTASSTSTSAMYTPLHGVGYLYFDWVANRVTRSTRNVCLLQKVPDPDFPTLKFPNPEEEGALQLAFLSADARKQSLIIAHDPDADRFAAAQKMPDGHWHRFTGDQMGFLLASYLLDRVYLDQAATVLSKDIGAYAASYPPNEVHNRDDAEVTRSNDGPAKASAEKQRKIAMLTTAVSSSMLSRMASTSKKPLPGLSGSVIAPTPWLRSTTSYSRTRKPSGTCSPRYLTTRMVLPQHRYSSTLSNIGGLKTKYRVR
jgi:hypothetical protein